MSSNGMQSMDDSQEYYDRMEELLLKSQCLSTQLEDKCKKRSKDVAIDGLNDTEVWKLERMESLANLTTIGLKRLKHFQTLSPIDFLDTIDHKLNDFKRNLEKTKDFKPIESHLFGKEVEDLDESEEQKEIIKLREEISKREKQLALIEVSILESDSIEPLIAKESQFRKEVQKLEKEIKELNRDISAGGMSRQIIEADIERHKVWIESHIEDSEDN